MLLPGILNIKFGTLSTRAHGNHTAQLTAIPWKDKQELRIRQHNFPFLPMSFWHICNYRIYFGVSRIFERRFQEKIFGVDLYIGNVYGDVAEESYTM